MQQHKELEQKLEGLLTQKKEVEKEKIKNIGWYSSIAPLSFQEEESYCKEEERFSNRLQKIDDEIASLIKAHFSSLATPVLLSIQQQLTNTEIRPLYDDRVNIRFKDSGTAKNFAANLRNIGFGNNHTDHPLHMNDFQTSFTVILSTIALTTLKQLARKRAAEKTKSESSSQTQILGELSKHEPLHRTDSTPSTISSVDIAIQSTESTSGSLPVLRADADLPTVEFQISRP